jgi:hypothetical protein
MAIRTILTRFREISSVPETDFSNGSITNYAEPVELAFYNEVMDETLAITTHSTGDDLVDEILSWLVAGFVYAELYRSKMHKSTGLLEWEWFEQQALKLMYARNPTKVEFNSNNAIYIIRNPGVSRSAYADIVRYDSADEAYKSGD